jgi:prepilin-type N-terminal cleavage/methylation domain-containing protein
MRKKIQNDSGFTFIEVIVAMVIIMIGLIPLLGLFNSGLKNYDRSTKTTVALHIAEEEIEALGEKNLSTFVENTNWSPVSGFNGYEYKNKVTYVPHDTQDGKPVDFYQIEVWVKWVSLGQEQEILLKNYTAGKQAE